MKPEIKELNVYRIRELNGKFTVEIKTFEIRGNFWRKYTVWSWEETNAWGGRCGWDAPIGLRSKTCKSLDEAKQMIKEWLTEPVYHYPNGSY